MNECSRCLLYEQPGSILMRLWLRDEEKRRAVDGTAFSQEEKNKIWECSYIVHSYEVGTHTSAPLTIVCNYLQDAAWHHAQILQLGYEALLKENRNWVLWPGLLSRWKGTPCGESRSRCARGPRARSGCSLFAISKLSMIPEREPVPLHRHG
jgi:hypothetical protein